jgi:hypothetical protein
MSSLFNYVKSQNVIFIYLALLLIFLPSFEAPKNLFLILLVFTWAYIARRDNNLGGKWKVIDTIFLFWIIFDIIIGINAVVNLDLPANGSKDIIKFILVGWVVSRLGLDKKQMIFLTVVTVIFTTIPLIESYYELANNGKRLHIELNSVGHVNHTAIYLLISYALSFSVLVLQFNKIGHTLKSTLLVTTLVLSYVVVVVTDSRAASGILVVFTLLLIFYAVYFYKNSKFTLAAILLVLLSVILITNNPPQVVSKFIHGTDLVGDSPRGKIRNHAYYTYKTHPLLGVGFGNYVHFGHEEIKDAVIKDKGYYDASQFLPSAHPHNIYYTYLVSGGIVMFSVFIWFWLHIVQIIFRVNKQSDSKWLILSSAGVVLTILGIGWVNTALAHENALVSMFVLGMLISEYREI